MYFNLAALSFCERARRANVLPFTLGPHGSNFSDVIAAVQPLLSSLDKGQILKVNGREAFVCAFTLYYVGDMPQQQGNSGLCLCEPLKDIDSVLLILRVAAI